MKKIIFVDIDGTIVDNVNGLNEVSLKTKYAFQELVKNHYVLIASGRSKCMLPQDILNLNPSGFLLSNGAYAEIDGKILINKTFTNDQLQEVLDFVDNEHYVAYLESQNWIYTKGMGSLLHQKFKSNWVTPPVYVEYSSNLKEEINVIMMAANSEKHAEQIEKHFNGLMKARRHQGFTSYDIDLPNVSKGSAVLELLNILKMDQEDAYAFGDGLNDLEMMKSVKHSIAMGNAFEELKKISSEICESAVEDGFYKACVRHGLIQEMDV